MFSAIVCTPAMERKVLAEFPKAPPTMHVSKLYGMDVYTKEQRADMWMFNDPALLTAYLGGKISEENLQQVVVDEKEAGDGNHK